MKENTKNSLDDNGEELPQSFKMSRSRIMYIENKYGLIGSARIGRVYFSKSGKTLYYRGIKFQSLKGSGFKSNYYDISSGGEFWISGVKKDENNKLYGGNKGVKIDSDVQEEYLAFINP